MEKLQHRRWLLLPTLGMVALAVYMTHSKALQSFFEPITYGAIHVDSPQVYTRERLINDRLSQEIWLTRQMDKLTGASALISGRMTSKNSDTLTVRIGDDDQRKEPQDDAQSQPLDNIKGSGLDGTSELSIQSFDEFRIRSAMRDQIRQMILETQLDDRHDLYGNSIYVLKFDAAIIPGNNTHAKAFIEVGFRPLPIRELLSDTEPGSKIRSYLALYLDRADNPKLAALRDLYNNWIRDLDWRLNDRVGKDFDALMESKWYQTDVLRLVNYLKNHGKSEESHFGSDTSPIRDQASAVLDLLNGPGFNTDRGGALLSNIVRTNSILWPHLADFLAIRAMQSVLSVTDRDVFVSRIQDNLVAGQSSHFLWAGQFSKYVSFEVNLTKNFLSPPRFQVREDLYQGDVVDRSCKIKSDQYVFVDAIRNDQYLVFAPSKVDWKLASYDPRWAAPGFVSRFRPGHQSSGW